ncbi:MAG: Dyp-type peroxidase [Novosphingobium sp.]|uniref:Dyp-type peroxidase n=1 Tax=Novosphingobium sp. TaxID=1874826 RepID=UPI00273628DD|nr:Dyp-type peroxidase [Novosphingobium sp.]MDP3550843.1 Dyp-type peroxidase [Novosphingobium sp.]
MSLSQDFITIAIPFGDKSEWCDTRDVEREIAELGNPAGAQIKAALLATGVVHFASIHAVAPEQPGSPAHLLIEATVDGDPDAAIELIAHHAGSALLPVLRLTSGIDKEAAVLPLLKKHSHGISQSPLRWPGKLLGLPFNGLPGLGVKAIDQNRHIVERAREIIGHARERSSMQGPQTLLKAVADGLRAELAALPDKQPPALAFCDTSDAPWLEFARTRWTLGWLGRALWGARALWLPLLVLPYLLSFGILLLVGESAVSALVGAVVPMVLFTSAILAVIALLLRRDEKANTPIDRTPAAAALGAMMAKENAPGVVQNHMVSITRLRPAMIRKLSLPLAFIAVATMARIGVMRRGFLATIGTIHAARWVVLPGTRQLVFLSNYDGSWESYLEDFITKASEGVTAAWSSSEGFPSTRLLFFGGAADGDRMKRFARGSMQPTPCWFSAHPDLSTTAMRKHALIVSGLLHRDRLENCPSEAEAWLDLFGSIPRPTYGLQYEEIQTLMFGGLRRHPHSMVVGLNFGAPRPAQGAHPHTHVQTWLASLIARDGVAFGDKPPENLVCNIAFSASGLRLLGLDEELALEGDGTDQGFPAAFALGMTHLSRKRALADPATLDWADDQTHAALLLYARDESVAANFAQIIAEAESHGLSVTTKIRTGINSFDVDKFREAWNANDDSLSAPAATRAFAHAQADTSDELSTEPFGFVDGVSQPLVAGFPGRHGAPDPVHGVQPGEFILGYTDNRGYFPPSPLVERTNLAPGLKRRLLPAPPQGQPLEFPDFSQGDVAARDFGRNGSYLVIRQLEQDVEGFCQQLDTATAHVCSQNDVINPHDGNPHRTSEWIAAKMLGRWRDGSALIDHPFTPSFRSGSDAVRRNVFLYKDSDAQGLRCPFGSHIRRSFPRDSLAQTDPAELSVTNRHRLLRRGRPYLDEKGESAMGTLFMCFNADLERQFEFVQQTWIGSPTFHGLEQEPDPFGMHNSDTPAALKARFTIHGRNAPLELADLQSHITLRGGGYFFLPGRHALWFLAGSALEDTPDGPGLALSAR